MKAYLPQLNWINSEKESMIALLETWVNVNSGSDNLAGLRTIRDLLKSAFKTLHANIEIFTLPSRFTIDTKGNAVECPHGDALLISKHPSAPIKILLGGHMDTVYPADSPFQTAQIINKKTMQGPGAADMKGGLVVLLKALQALERSPFSGKIGWSVVLNPDEEVGSSGSEALLRYSARNHQLGLWFEPSFSDGAIVSERKGSVNFAIVAKGRAAHAGRDFISGRNAISALCRVVNKVDQLTDLKRGITINVGNIQGGGPINIVPDLAICHVNARVTNPKDFLNVKMELEQLINHNQVEGIQLNLHEETSREPKPFDDKTRLLFQALQQCASELGFSLETRPSGGVSDGNILSSEGLPTIDSLGVVGGNIHTFEEYIMLESLPQRASLSAYFLMMLASGETDLKLLAQ